MNYRLTLRNGVLTRRKAAADAASATATITVTYKLRLMTLLLGDLTSPGIEVAGDATALGALVGALDRPDPSFDIVLP